MSGKTDLQYEMISKWINNELILEDVIKQLQISRSQCYSLKKSFDPDDKLCFTHKNSNNTNAKKRSVAEDKFILDKYQELCVQMSKVEIYIDRIDRNVFTFLNFNLFYLIIKEQTTYSKSTTRNVLLENEIFPPKSKKNSSKFGRHSVVGYGDEINIGEEIQIDAKVGIIIDKEQYVSHLAVDAKSNHILGSIIDKGETTASYIELLILVFTKYGLPSRIVTDRRMSFYEPNNKHTLIAQALRQLNIELITTSNGNRNGKIETAHNTFQNNILQLLMLGGFDTLPMVQNNVNSIIDEYNLMRGRDIENMRNYFARSQYSTLELRRLFGKKFYRTVNQYHQFLYNNKLYYAVNKEQNIMNLAKGCHVCVVEQYDGEIEVLFQSRYHNCEIANEITLSKYNNTKTQQIKTVNKVEKERFVYQKKRYAIYNNIGEIVTIKVDDELIKVVDNDKKILYVFINNNKYSIKENATKVVKIIEIYVSILYDSTFVKNGIKYALIFNLMQVVFEKGTRLKIPMLDGIPQEFVYKKMVITFEDISSTNLQIVLPKSHQVAQKTYDKYANKIIRIY